jgi:hypothetical protein
VVHCLFFSGAGIFSSLDFPNGRYEEIKLAMMKKKEQERI